MRFPTYPSVLTLTLLVPTIAAQGFQNSCSSIGFSTPQLSAECSQENGQQHFTELDLDFCVGNQFGSLVRQVKYVVSSQTVSLFIDEYLIVTRTHEFIL